MYPNSFLRVCHLSNFNRQPEHSFPESRVGPNFIAEPNRSEHRIRLSDMKNAFFLGRKDHLHRLLFLKATTVSWAEVFRVFQERMNRYESACDSVGLG